MFSKLSRRSSFAVMLAVLFLLVIITTASAVQQFEGEWQGGIEVPGSLLGLNVVFTEDNGSLTGLMDIPAQGAYDINLAPLTVENSMITFRLEGIPGDP